jgi:histidinol-phosphate/aromatic aminotransferase/cobyric acid decarboxylase-like protein
VSSSAEPRSHGGLLDRELAGLGGCADEILDVSVNVNPYGPCAAVFEAVRNVRIDRYPDPTAYRAREAIAHATSTRPSGVVVGNGAADLLWSLARALLAPGDRAVIVEPTFSEMWAAVESVGARPIAWRARAEDQFAVRLDAVADLARRSEAAMVYLCTPANPTGIGISASAVAELAGSLTDCTVVLDESFLFLSEQWTDHSHPMPCNVVRVRSLTKDHALAGIRVGYLLAPDGLAARIETSRPPWTTNALAQVAAIAAMRAQAFRDQSRERVLADRRRCVDALAELGFCSSPTTTLFFMVRVEDGSATRARLLARHCVLVRDCASFGLPTFVRVCAQPIALEPRLLTAFEEESRLR